MKVKNKFEVNLSKEVLEQAEQDFAFWESEGRFHIGVDDQCSLDDLPEWIDHEKLKKSQKVARDLFTSMGLSSVTGLFFVLQLPKGLGPLLATGQSKNVSSLFSRYLSTVLHVESWFIHDFLDPSSKGHKSMRLVRLMHKRAGLMMNSKYPLDQIQFKPELLFANAQLDASNVKENEPETKERRELWVNQLDMLLTQWAFVGPMILEPEGFGVHGHNAKSLEAIMYLWQVIGHCIGINPKFNLFNDCDYSLGYARCKLILERVYAPALTQVLAPEGARMTLATVKGMQYYSPYVTWAGVMRRAYELFNIDGKNINRLVREERNRIQAQKQGKPYESTWNDNDLKNIDYSKGEFDENGNRYSEEERKRKLLEAGYNDRYEVKVWDGQPFERVELISRRDRIMCNLLSIQLNYPTRWKPYRAFARKINLIRHKNAHQNRTKIRQTCETKHDQKWQFDRCPFSAAIEYEDFSFVDKKM